MNMVMINKEKSPRRKMISAVFSNRSLFEALLFSARKENKLLAINMKMAAAVNSSMRVLPVRFNTFSEVSTTKQIPNKVEEAFRM
jgi:hypothetical protein